MQNQVKLVKNWVTASRGQKGKHRTHTWYSEYEFVREFHADVCVRAIFSYVVYTYLRFMRFIRWCSIIAISVVKRLFMYQNFTHFPSLARYFRLCVRKFCLYWYIVYWLAYLYVLATIENNKFVETRSHFYWMLETLLGLILYDCRNKRCLKSDVEWFFIGNYKENICQNS